MSEVARQFNIMSETLRKGIAGMEDAAMRGERLGLQKAQTEYGMEADKEERAYRRETRQEDVEFRTSQATESKRRFETGATVRKAADITAREQIDADKQRSEWEKLPATSAAMGMDKSNPTHLGWLLGDLRKSLKQKHNIETVYEDVDGDGNKDFRYYRNGKQMSNKFMAGNTVALSFALEYDYDKSQAGEVQNSQMALNELQQKKVDPNSTAFKDAQTRLAQAQETQADMVEHPSKYEYLKLQRAEEIYGRMRAPFKEQFKGLMDVQRLKMKEMVKLDIANRRASGANLGKKTYSQDIPGGGRREKKVYVVKGGGITAEERNLIADGWTDVKIIRPKGFISIRDKQAIETQITKRKRVIAKLETSGEIGVIEGLGLSEEAKDELRSMGSVAEAIDAVKDQVAIWEKRRIIPEQIRGPDGETLEITDELIQGLMADRGMTEDEVLDQLLLYKGYGESTGSN